MLQFNNRWRLGRRKSRVEALELHASVGGSKAPVDPCLGPIAARLPRRHFLAQRGDIGHPTGQALLGQCCKFTFSHVEPTPMFRSVMNFQLAGEPLRFGGREGVIQRRRCMRVEMITS